ncbi:hypothetical protein MJO28_013762 [Puccinia striiformis f. sp. tritici]|uniref:UBC core domain-containing protein n=2 Tax=Puccinia striiformis TaxID=27350 RepID=A0A2S4UGT0_9BASI|nr:hypothetical protein MJO28_013762 [Puccinia striiformis f. sp. tritici]POV96492.1 hypothetical protein PSTT_15615 [Puccinia striiformis]
MASKQAQKRLMKEHAEITKSPPPFIIARPKETNILEWHYILRGPPDTPYFGGECKPSFPFIFHILCADNKNGPPHPLFFLPGLLYRLGNGDIPSRIPPGIVMMTPSGRFQPAYKICTSMSDYHPDSWNPAWGVSSILTGLLSFMVTDEVATGAVSCSSADRRHYAKASHAHNAANLTFKTIFPEYSNPAKMVDLPNMG